METLQSFLAWGLPFAQDFLLAIVIFVIGWLVSKWTNRGVQRALTRGKVDLALARFLGSIAQYTVLVAAVIAALGTVGIETTSVVAVFASAGLAVGLALQGSLSNFASGVMILFFKPFVLDDVITAAGHTGKVVDIGLFATSLNTPDNMKIIIPNSALTGGSIVNITTMGTRRGTVEVGVAYGLELEKVQAVLEKAAAKPGLVLQDPAPSVAFVGLGASSLDFAVMTWCRSADYLAMLHAVRCEVYDELNAAGIEIPFNQIVVHQAEGEA
jgi:small conductance mechanosensitive channel